MKIFNTIFEEYEKYIHSGVIIPKNEQYTEIKEKIRAKWPAITEKGRLRQERAKYILRKGRIAKEKAEEARGAQEEAHEKQKRRTTRYTKSVKSLTAQEKAGPPTWLKTGAEKTKYRTTVRKALLRRKGQVKTEKKKLGKTKEELGRKPEEYQKAEIARMRGKKGKGEQQQKIIKETEERRKQIEEKLSKIQRPNPSR